MLPKSLTTRAITAIATIAIGTATATCARATIFDAYPQPFPANSGFDLSAPSGICVTSNECTYNVYINNLTEVNATQITNGFQEQLTANFSASFVNPGTLAPTATATLSLIPGTYFTVDILGGFNPFTNPVGTFPETLVAASFEGADSAGNALTASLTATPSTGSVTIAATAGGFDITNTFTVNAQSTVNGSPVVVPPLGATGTAAPEPASLGLLAVSMVGTVVARRRRRSV